MKKIKLFTALLAACLTLTLLPVGALAVDIYIDSPAPEHIWLIPGSGQRFSIVPPFSPANKDSGAEVTWADLSNLVWFGFFLNDEFELPYTDVPKDSWFYPGVCYVYARSLMDGVSEDTFAPHQTVTRALAWTVLASMNGADTRPSPGELWYERGMNWVVKYQVSDGSNPLDPITREPWAGPSPSGLFRAPTGSSLLSSPSPGRNWPLWCCASCQNPGKHRNVKKRPLRPFLCSSGLTNFCCIRSGPQ